jgi:hypothetical protein
MIARRPKSPRLLQIQCLALAEVLAARFMQL